MKQQTLETIRNNIMENLGLTIDYADFESCRDLEKKLIRENADEQTCIMAFTEYFQNLLIDLEKK